MTEEQLVAVLMPVCLEKRAALLCARLNKHEFEAVESAATKPLLERIAQKQSRIDQLIQEVAAGADAEASQRERIAELEAKLAQLVPDGWKLAPVKPTEAMVVQGAGIIDDNGGNARWSDMREAWDAMLAAAPAAPEQQEPLSTAWAEGYAAGIDDERTSEANIGIAGFGAKVNPNRKNPYGSTKPEHPDNLAVDAFAVAMKEKLAAARAKGRGGWQECDAGVLSGMLREHVKKGDPRDVANFCMFLWSLGYGIAQASNAQQAEQQTKRCPNCDDTGDVNSIDGEWRGTCHCPAGQASNAQQAEAQEPQ